MISISWQNLRSNLRLPGSKDFYWDIKISIATKIRHQKSRLDLFFDLSIYCVNRTRQTKATKKNEAASKGLILIQASEKIAQKTKQRHKKKQKFPRWIPISEKWSLRPKRSLKKDWEKAKVNSNLRIDYEKFQIISINSS